MLISLNEEIVKAPLKGGECIPIGAMNSVSPMGTHILDIAVESHKHIIVLTQLSPFFWLYIGSNIAYHYDSTPLQTLLVPTPMRTHCAASLVDAHPLRGLRGVSSLGQPLNIISSVLQRC